MKKTLVALAALAVVGAASAQSSVTLYGRIDAAVGSARTTHRLDQTLAGFGTDLGTVDGGALIRAGTHTGNRWGMKGSEDLGGGLKAIFQLENGFTVDTGAAAQGGLLFGRQAFVGLAGGFGSLTLGRQYDPIDNMYGTHDAFGYSGYGAMNYVFNANCGITSAVNGGGQGAGDCVGRQNNSVFYTTPDMGGFNAGMMWAPGENKNIPTAGIGAGNMWGLQAGYANGPVNVGGAWQVNKAQGGATAVKNWELGGSYDLGAAKLYLQFEGSKIGGAANVKDTGFQIGATMPMGAATLMASYARENEKADGTKYATASAFSLMGQYALSKRTYVYAAYLAGQIDPTEAGLATQKDRSYGLGLVHNF